VADKIKAITDAGIVVFGHIGHTPQSSANWAVSSPGTHAGDCPTGASGSLAVQGAGAHALLVEAVAPEVTAVIRQRLTIPVYGIGAGCLVTVSF